MNIGCKTIKIIVIYVILCLTNVLFAEINVATSANMKEAATLLASTFSKQNNIKINIISSSSGNLYQQIINGAPFQLFISADVDYPNKLFEKKLTNNKPYIYGYGSLVIWVKDKKTPINNVQDITTSNRVKYIAIANPKLAPYGRESIKVLTKLGLLDKIKNKIIYADSINAVNQLISTASVDIAFTSKSSIILKEDAIYMSLPDNTYNKIPQAMVMIKNNDKNLSKEAQSFYNYIISAEGKNILTKYGYIVK